MHSVTTADAERLGGRGDGAGVAFRGLFESTSCSCSFSSIAKAGSDVSKHDVMIHIDEATTL